MDFRSFVLSSGHYVTTNASYMRIVIITSEWINRLQLYDLNQWGKILLLVSYEIYRFKGIKTSCI